ncbi:MAG: BrnA antitoxin family protein [Thermoanaerobaculia bacterium]
MPQDVSARRGWGPARHVVDAATGKLPTRRVTINLDEDIIAIFKAEALRGGPPYQVAINQALRAYLHDREVSAHDRAVQTVLTALDDEAVQRKLRSIH